jgi:hypothetical protein
MGVVGEWRDMWKVVIYFRGLRIREREEQGSIDRKSPEEEIKGHSRLQIEVITLNLIHSFG